MFDTIARLFRPKPVIDPGFERFPDFLVRWNQYRNTPLARLCLKSIADEIPENDKEQGWLRAAAIDAAAAPADEFADYVASFEEELLAVSHDEDEAREIEADDPYWRDSEHAVRAGMTDFDA